MATFVLIHGAGLGGWAWKAVAQQLTDRHHVVYHPSLTGQGERSHITSGVTLQTHLDDVTNLLVWEDLHDIVLCGHSYGGMVATGVADSLPQRIGALVYLDALVPRDGQSAAMTRAEATRSDDKVVPADIYRVRAGRQSEIDRKITPFPPGCADERIALEGRYLRIDPKIYIRAARFESTCLDWFHDQAAKDPGWTVRFVEAGHLAMIDAPHEVAESLAEVGNIVDTRLSSAKPASGRNGVNDDEQGESGDV